MNDPGMGRRAQFADVRGRTHRVDLRERRPSSPRFGLSTVATEGFETAEAAIRRRTVEDAPSFERSIGR